MAGKRKQETITFKVDEALWDAIRRVPNRSEFIRAAILSALEGICPLCNGVGSLTPDQRRHWDAFAKSHAVAQCADCDAIHLVCVAAGDDVHE
ncbi:MAG: hypothetical protein JXB62_07995 [Pirellulales bacterium]|nr:hypothetical protein [Pirellulales bacterium]